jgi:DNA-binding transcriptional regulator YhcF (GntR family)
MIEFYLDRHDGTSPYGQLVRQVKQALLLDILHVGDQLPTVKEVVGKLAINPNTVLKAYRELEHEGLITTKPGVGTFVASSIAGPAVDHHPQLRAKLSAWLTDARLAGLDEESILALFASEMRNRAQAVVS